MDRDEDYEAWLDQLEQDERRQIEHNESQEN
jgi:hypothetical protein